MYHEYSLWISSFKAYIFIVQLFILQVFLYNNYLFYRLPWMKSQMKKTFRKIQTRWGWLNTYQCICAYSSLKMICLRHFQYESSYFLLLTLRHWNQVAAMECTNWGKYFLFCGSLACEFKHRGSDFKKPLILPFCDFAVNDLHSAWYCIPMLYRPWLFVGKHFEIGNTFAISLYFRPFITKFCRNVANPVQNASVRLKVLN